MYLFKSNEYWYMFFIVEALGRKWMLSHLKDEDQEPSRCPSPRRENTMPKDTSWVPISRASAGTAGPRALMNTPSRKKERNMASEGTSLFTSRARTILPAEQTK